MAFDVRPATRERFDDVATILGPKSAASSVCWCLSHRLDSRANRELVGPARADYVRELTMHPVAPGVLGYDGEEVVGWAAVAPRAEVSFARSRKIPQVDDQPVWSIWCLRVRGGHRGRGVPRGLIGETTHLTGVKRGPGALHPKSPELSATKPSSEPMEA